MFGNKLLFEVPVKFKADLAKGALRRIGANLHDVDTGRILGHIQEAGGFNLNLAGGPWMAGLDLASQLGENIQNEQIKAGIRRLEESMETLQLMTGATLGLSVLNLGVSIAGFTIISKKLNGLGKKLDRMEGKLAEMRSDAQRGEMRHRARDRAGVKSLIRRAEEAWIRKDGEAIWREAADRILAEEIYCQELLENGTGSSRPLLLDREIPANESLAALDTLSALHQTRFKCLILIDEWEAARTHCRIGAEWMKDHLLEFDPTRLASAHQNREKRPHERLEDTRVRLLDYFEGLCRILRQQKEVVESLPALVDTIEVTGSGRRYLEALMEQSDRPLVIVSRN